MKESGRSPSDDYDFFLQQADKRTGSIFIDCFDPIINDGMFLGISRRDCTLETTELNLAVDIVPAARTFRID